MLLIAEASPPRPRRQCERGLDEVGRAAIGDATDGKFRNAILIAVAVKVIAPDEPLVAVGLAELSAAKLFGQSVECFGRGAIMAAKQDDAEEAGGGLQAFLDSLGKVCGPFAEPIARSEALADGRDEIGADAGSKSIFVRGE
jgi:hypothetical protein